MLNADPVLLGLGAYLWGTVGRYQQGRDLCLQPSAQMQDEIDTGAFSQVIVCDDQIGNAHLAENGVEISL